MLNSADKEKEAKDFIKKGEAKMNPGFFSSLFGSKNQKYEEAIECFERAGQIYKLLQNWKEAAVLFEKCGDIQMKIENDTAKYYLEASHAYSFFDVNKSAASKKKAIQFYIDNGKFQNAGRLMWEIAEKLSENRNYKEAATAYKESANYYSMENSNMKSYEQGSLIKYADIICETIEENEGLNDDLFKEIYGIYEKIGFSYLNIPLLKSSAKDYFFKALCVHLAFGKNSSMSEKLYEKFINEDPTMINSREDKFLKGCINAIKMGEYSEYEKVEEDYKRYSDIDKWRKSIFRRISLCASNQTLNPNDFT